MSNQAEKFYQDNSKMIQQLTESLSAILSKFDQGIIPGEPEKSDAMYMLDTYLETLIKFKETKQEAYKKVSPEVARAFDEKIAVKELTNSKVSIYILLKLAREKMMLTSHHLFDTDEGKQFILDGYCDEIIGGAENIHYYILSEKGEKAVKSKTITSSLQNKVCTAVVPQGIINDSFKWSTLYVRRVEMLNKYYRNVKGDAEHIIFSLDETKEMVFGCEIGESTDVIYAFAGIFDEKIDSHMKQLKSIVSSGLVDRLIVLNSSEEGKKLFEGEGLSTADYPQIEFVVVK